MEELKWKKKMRVGLLLFATRASGKGPLELDILYFCLMKLLRGFQPISHFFFVHFLLLFQVEVSGERLERED